MDQISEIILRLRIVELGAQLALREVERVVLNHEIDDPKTDPSRRLEAQLRRDRSLVEWGEFMTELHELRNRHELALTSRGSLN